MKTKTIWKNQKPINIDFHFKYKCPNNDCVEEHWLSLKQIKHKNFLVVCDCGIKFQPKHLNKITLSYSQSVKITQNIKNDCISMLVNNGFLKEEAENLLIKASKKCKSNKSAILVRYIIKHLGELEND